MTKTIEEILEEGRELYNQENYEEALDKFKEAKALDTGGHTSHCDYGIGSSYFKLAETTENLTQKRLYFNAAANSFKIVAQNDHDRHYEDINTNIGEALEGADLLEEALTYYENNVYSNRINNIKKKLGKFYEDTSKMIIPYHYIDNFEGVKTVYPPSNYTAENAHTLIQDVYQNLNILHRKSNFLFNVCYHAKVLDLAYINQEVYRLERDEPLLYDYYNEFNWTLQTTINACIAICSGLIVPDAGHLERKSPAAFMKFFCYFLDLVAIGPYASVMTLLHDAGDNLYNIKKENELLQKLKLLFNIIKSKFNGSFFQEIEIKNLALHFTKLKKDTILNIKNEESPLLEDNKTFKDAIKQKFNSFKAITYKYFKTAKEYTNISELAFEDVALLLNYLYENHDVITRNKEQSFVGQIMTVTTAELSKIWFDKQSANNNYVFNTIDCEMLIEVENNLIEIDKIRDRIKSKQWENIIRYISFSGMQRGLNIFTSEEYYKEQRKNKDILCTEKDLNNFKLFMFREICKSMDKELV